MATARFEWPMIHDMRLVFQASIVIGGLLTATGLDAAETSSVWSGFEEQKVEAGMDILSSSTLTLTQGSVAYETSIHDLELQVNFNHGGMFVDYQPNRVADLIGQRRQLVGHRPAFQIDLGKQIHPNWTARIGTGFYDGFTNYRTLWIDEYYRQQFSGITGYQEASPYGANGQVGLRWDYLPGTGTMELTLSYQQDQISPGYDRPLFQPLERGRDRLKSGSASFSIEQVLTPRLRGRAQYNIIDTTNRTARHAAQISFNYSLQDHWVARIAAGQTREIIGFRSQSYEAIIEHDWENRWFLGLGARYYRDNGDIENSLFVVTTAAPALTTRQVFLSFKWMDTRSAIKLEAGPYETNYAAPNSIVAPFGFLYSERNFFRVGISYSRRF